MQRRLGKRWPVSVGYLGVLIALVVSSIFYTTPVLCWITMGWAILVVGFAYYMYREDRKDVVALNGIRGIYGIPLVDPKRSFWKYWFRI